MTLQPLAIAKMFKEIVAQEEAQLVILGKQAIDDDSLSPAAASSLHGKLQFALSDSFGKVLCPQGVV